jgi:DNA-directed RNA polymerase specialized sigma24 family protein
MSAVALKRILAPFRRAFGEAAEAVGRSRTGEAARRGEPIEIDVATVADAGRTASAAPEAAPEPAGAEEAAGAEEQASPPPRVGHIEDAFMKLREKERLVLALRYYEKLTEHDVASVLHMTLAEVQRIQQEALSGVIRHLACASKG